MAAACCGIENNLGNLITPVRACFNKAEDDFLGGLPDLYVQMVLARNADDKLVHTGLYVGDDLETYLAAARQSRDENITVFDEPVEKIVCVMQGDEFFSTWVANKSVYRTRMALADGGELVVIAPGLKRFGEQPEVDAFIRKYGYVGTPRVMDAYRQNLDMQDLAHATAHLIHGSSEGRFKITYAPGHLSQQEIEGVNFALPRRRRSPPTLPARRVQTRLEHDGRRRAVLLHPDALSRPVGPSLAAAKGPGMRLNKGFWVVMLNHSRVIRVLAVPESAQTV